MGEGSRWYDANGKEANEVENKSKGGMRPTNKADARKLGLYPSVTSLMKIIENHGLKVWFEGMILSSAYKLASDTESMGRLTEADFNELVMVGAKEYAIEARDEGIEIHEAIETVFRGYQLKAEHTHFLDMTFELVSKIEALGYMVDDFAPEKSGVFIDAQTNAGFGFKMDLPVKDKPVIFDIKTREFEIVKGVPMKNGKKAVLDYESDIVQLAGYSKGCGYENPDLYNIYISRTTHDIVIKQWEEEEIKKGQYIFNKLYELWWAKEMGIYL